MRRVRKVSRTLILVAGITFLLLPSAPAGAEFQERAAINDEVFERVATTGSTRAFSLQTEKSMGLGVDRIVPGLRYTVRVSGTYLFTGQSGRVADAECATDEVGDASHGRQWRIQRWGTAASTDHFDVRLLAAGKEIAADWIPEDPFPPTDEGLIDATAPRDREYGQAKCSSTHTYFAEFVSQEPALQVRVSDPWSYTDNLGSLAVTVIRDVYASVRRYDCPKWVEEPFNSEPESQDLTSHEDHETYEHAHYMETGVAVGEVASGNVMLDARRHAGQIPEPGMSGSTNPSGRYYPHRWGFEKETGHDGIYSCNHLLPDSVYQIVVVGTYTYNDSVSSGNAQLAQADAECTTGKTAGDAAWRRNRFVTTDPNTGVTYDYMDLTIGYYGFVDWQPLYDENGDGCADDEDHSYRVMWSPAGRAPIHFKLYDFGYNEIDNRGSLCMDILKVESGGGIDPRDAVYRALDHLKERAPDLW